MRVSIDGKQAEVEPGTTVGSAAKALGIELETGCILAVKKEVESEKVQTNLYEVYTTKGKMVIRIECEKILDGWRKTFKKFEGAGIRWVTRDAVVFGPIISDFEPSRESVELRQYEITLSLGGYSSDNTQLVFGRRLHSSLYAPPKECGVLGRVVYGRHLVDELKMGDGIVKVEPVIETKIGEGAIFKADRDYQIKEPVQIFTKLEIELDSTSPLSGEIVYKVTGNDTLTIDRMTSRFIACDSMTMGTLASERQERRSRGFVTVRNSGANSGSVYVYLKEAALTPAHNIAGMVREGMELADVTGNGDRISVKVTPQMLDLRGRTQKDSEELLKSRGIKQKRSGDSSDSAIVVEQDPPTTLELLIKGEATCFGVKPSELIGVRLFSREAPNSVRYFRRLTGLELRKTGIMTVYFTTPKSEMILFKGDEVMAKELLPENVPERKVGANILGVTNAVKKFAGMVGVRFTESTEFGPTAEKFEGTNIIGEVVANLDGVKKLGGKKTVYITEVK